MHTTTTIMATMIAQYTQFLYQGSIGVVGSGACICIDAGFTRTGPRSVRKYIYSSGKKKSQNILNMVASSISDEDIAEIVSRVKSNLVSSCGEYMSSEFSVTRMCRSKLVQLLLPYVLIVVSILVLKPAWAMYESPEPKTAQYRYGKIALMALVIYIFSLLVFMGVGGYISPEILMAAEL